MTPQEVLIAAKQGNPEAIAALMNRHLQPKGITAQGSFLNDCLYIVLESAQPPNQQALVAFISKGVQNLQVASIKRLIVYGKRSGEEAAAWTEQVELSKAQPLAPVKQPAASIEKPETSSARKTPQSLPVILAIVAVVIFAGFTKVIVDGNAANEAAEKLRISADKLSEESLTQAQKTKDLTASLEKSQHQRSISEADFPGTWMLTVDKGELLCVSPKSIVFIAPDGTKYGVNGTATGFGYPEIAPIWKSNPTIEGAKIDISPLIDEGLKLCE